MVFSWNKISQQRNSDPDAASLGVLPTRVRGDSVINQTEGGQTVRLPGRGLGGGANILCLIMEAEERLARRTGKRLNRRAVQGDRSSLRRAETVAQTAKMLTKNLLCADRKAV